jgi:UDP-3-O-acyl N-acetylglucosamine deacetylase
MKQKTIQDTVSIEGIGLQTGAKARVTLKSSPINSGINFIRVDLPNKPLFNLQAMDPGDSAAAERRTTLGFGGLQIQTTEHLLAALSGFGVDNIVIELDNVEFPGMDGSSRDFADALKRAGIVEQDEPRKVLDVAAPVWCRDRDALLAVFPDEAFRVSYTLSYPGIGAQFFSVVVSEESFVKEVAPARTFCSEAEALELLKRGLGKGATYENTLVMGPSGPIKNTLRFADEPVRHKVLDLIGDLYLAGSPIRGHVVAIKSGHRLNMELVKKLKEL